MKTFIGTFDNQTISRKSTRHFSHAVVLIEKSTGKISEDGFCGSLALAEKQLANSINFFNKVGEGKFYDYKIIEVAAI